MAVTIQIAGVDKTTYVKKNSLSVESVLTRQMDRCSFTIPYYESPFNYRPVIGQEIVVYDGATKIFGGFIVQVEQTMDDFLILDYRVECQDYTRFLDRKLVIDAYTGQTVNQIIADFMTTYELTDRGFTSNNVSCTTVIDKISFNYQSIAQCLTTMADLVGYDWYVDYDKDIHFFAKESLAAPFSATDTNGNLVNASLVIRKDNTQVRNVIYVRGSEYLGDTFTSVFISDGSQFVYPLAYKYEDLTLSVTGVSWDVGLEPQENSAAFDVMWNREARALKFRSDRIPSNGSTLRVGGRPYLPVVAKVTDGASVATMSAVEGGSGEYEYVIIDKSIASKEAARERARAELNAYSQSISEGSFMTYTSGLRAGMSITINSTVQNINETFLINRVRATMYSNDAMKYDVSLVTFKTLGIIDVLQKLLLDEKKKIEINPNEVLDVVESTDETITLTETFTASVFHNAQYETVTMTETMTAQSLNYDVDWVYGPYTWGGDGSGDHNREGAWDGSYWE